MNDYDVPLFYIPGINLSISIPLSNSIINEESKTIHICLFSVIKAKAKIYSNTANINV